MASDSDLEVKFGASTDDLDSAIKLLKAQIAGLSAEAQGLAQKMVVAGKAGDDTLVKTLKTIKAEAATLSSTLEVAKDGLDKVGHGALGAGAGFSYYARELRALADESAAGRWRQFDGSLINLASHAAQAAVAFAAVNPVLTGVGVAALAAAAGVGYFVYEEIAAANAIKSLQLDAVVNGFQLTNDAAGALRDSIEKLANVSASDAASIAKPFLELGQNGEIVAQLVSVHLPALAEYMGKDIPQAAEQVARYFTDLDGAGRKFVNSTDSATEAQRRQYAAFVESGQSARAYGVIVDIMNQQLAEYEKQQKQAAVATDFWTNMLAGAAAEGGNFSAAQDVISSAVSAATKQIEQQSGALGALRGQLESAANAARTFREGMAEAIQIDKVGTEITKTTGEIEKMKAALTIANQGGDSESAAKLSTAIEKAGDDLKRLQEMASDGLLGRDASQKLASQNRMLADTYKGPQVGLLTQQRDNAQRVANDPSVSAKERAAAAQEVADKTKAIESASYADFQAAENLKVIAASKNSAAVISIREEEVARARAVFGAGSNEERAAIEAVARAKEAASNRGAAVSNKEANDELRAAQERAQGEIRTIQEATRAREQQLNDDLSRHRISTQQWLAQSTAALQGELAQLRVVYAQEAQLAGLKGSDLERIHQQQAQQERQINAQIVTDARKAADDEQRAWQSALGSIVGEINSQLRGVLTGAESWKQAMISIFDDLAMKAIEKLEEIAVEKAALALVNVATGGTGGDLFGLLSGLIPAHDTGVWNIPQDHVAMVHRGEMIVPAGPAAAMRDGYGLGGGGGGSVAIHPTTNLHVHAIDSASTAAWARQRGPELAKGLEQAARHGALLGLRARFT